MKINLQDKIAVVTGGAQGIGLATSKALAACGAKVVVADVDLTAMGKAAAEIPGSRSLRMDVSVETDVGEGIKSVLDQFGKIDILVNNAGVNTIRQRVTIDEFSTEEWDRVMSIDLRGQFLVSRRVAAAMSGAGSGKIVNIASVLGVVPARLQCAFTAAKAGIINLTKAMAIELAARGIQVNCVAPGTTITPATKSLFFSEDAVMKERARQVLSHIPMGRAAQPEEIAHAILFFADPASSYITGQTLCVDGGWTAGGFLRDF